jgi:hypothetical protein
VADERPLKLKTVVGIERAALAVVLAAPPARKTGDRTSSAFIPRELIDTLATALREHGFDLSSARDPALRGK